MPYMIWTHLAEAQVSSVVRTGCSGGVQCTAGPPGHGEWVTMGAPHGGEVGPGVVAPPYAAFAAGRHSLAGRAESQLWLAPELNIGIEIVLIWNEHKLMSSIYTSIQQQYNLFSFWYSCSLFYFKSDLIVK